MIEGFKLCFFSISWPVDVNFQFANTIGIATEPTDIAAELDTAANVKTYDTELNYTGAITFGEYWCYFSQIKDVIKKNEYVEDKEWMNE